MSNRIDRCAADRRAHDRAWAPERVRDADGLTRFQRRAEAALAEAGRSLTERAVAVVRGGGPDDRYVTGLVGRGGARVYLYGEGVELVAGDRSVRVEGWEVGHPDDLLRAFLDQLHALDPPAG